jgi:hypothetical protein
LLRPLGWRPEKTTTAVVKMDQPQEITTNDPFGESDPFVALRPDMELLRTRNNARAVKQCDEVRVWLRQQCAVGLV